MSNTAFLSIGSQIRAYANLQQNNNPRARFVDWHKSLKGLHCTNPRSESYTIAVGQSLEIFNGRRDLDIDGTTEFDLTSSAVQVGRYRVTYTGEGTAPGFRISRGVDLSGESVNLNVRPDGTVIVTVDSALFGAVQIGDHVFIPGTATGDGDSPFNPINQGFWEVLGKPTSTSLQLVRLQRSDMKTLGETVDVTEPYQFEVFSADGVQVGDRIELSAGFSVSILKTYTIRAVTPMWIEFSSPSPLPDESGVLPGEDGLAVYAFAKRYIRVEADQECVVQVNGDTGESQRISPWAPADLQLAGEYTRTGPTWGLNIVNKSSTTVTVCIISVE